MDYNDMHQMFLELRTQMASIQAEVRSTKEDLKKELGGLVERQVRKGLADKYGRDFAPCFVVHGLSGLARLCKARKKFCPHAEGKNKDASDPQHQSLAVRKLSQALLDEEMFLDLFNAFRPGQPPIRKGDKFIENSTRLSDAAAYLTRLKNHQRDTDGVWKLLRNFFETVRDNDKEEVFKLLEDDSGLAIAMLDIYLKEAERRRKEEQEEKKVVEEEEKKHKEVEEKKQEEKTEEEKKQEAKKQLYLKNELEIDVRGDLSRIGEIKSTLTTNNRKRAKSQLQRAARLLLWAAVVLGKNQKEMELVSTHPLLDLGPALQNT